MADNVSLVAAFGGGMLSFVSPCVLPLVPGYLSLMSGVSVTELSAADRSHIVRSTLLFVAGFTLVFTLLGLTATAVGQALLDHRTVLNRVAGAVVIVMGLFLAGVVTPRRLMADTRFHISPSAMGAWAPPVMGMAFAFGWTPCIGPILAGVLTLASNESRIERGALLLVVYSLGLGVPFVLTGVALGRLTGVFTWFRRHFRVLNLVSGALLVAFGFLLFTNQLGWLSGKVTQFLDAVGLDALTTI